MSDAELQRYKRELERTGADPREIAAGLLGVTADRYLLLARPESVRFSMPALTEEQKIAADAQRPTEPEPRWRRVTGVNAALGAGEEIGPEPERWRALWALPFTTFEELQRVTVPLNARGIELVVWDTADAVIVEWFGRSSLPWSYDRLEEVWREPHRDGPFTPWSDMGPNARARFGVPEGTGNVVDTSDACLFCGQRIEADGVSCHCPPCVDCRGPHPLARCPRPLCRSALHGGDGGDRTSCDRRRGHADDHECMLNGRLFRWVDGRVVSG